MDTIIARHDDRDLHGWGEAIDARPLLVDLSTLDDEEVGRRLVVLLSQISETCYCAGWLIGLEELALTWSDLPRQPVAWGIDTIPEAAISALAAARVRLGDRWVCWDDEAIVLTSIDSPAWRRSGLTL